jgi:hypothetical protein
MSQTLYELDFYTWTQQQAALLRSGQWQDLDTNNLAEELEDMGRSEKRELQSRLEVLLMHLLKWEFQPNLRSRSWRLTLKEQRLRLHRLLQDNPSLRSHCEQYLEQVYPLAVVRAEQETGLETFPETCPYSLEQTLNLEFLPGAQDHDRDQM